jgi:exodeoxyribonuclease-3
MKIVSWNINGYRSISGQNPKLRYGEKVQINDLFDYVKQESPDLLLMQETKSEKEQIDEHLLAPDGYKSYFSACKIKKGYSGVGIFSKREPEYINDSIGYEKFDNEGRVLEIGLDGISYFNVYFPNGQQGQDRVDYKLEFYNALFEKANERRKEGRKVIVSGDYNTAHTPIDLARPKENEKTSGFLPEERVKLDEIVAMGYSDSFRLLNKEPNQYTWWSARGRARENNVGWRIDYHFVSNDLIPKVKESYHQPKQLGSDHCPIVLILD